MGEKGGTAIKLWNLGISGAMTDIREHIGPYWKTARQRRTGRTVGCSRCSKGSSSCVKSSKWCAPKKSTKHW